MTVRMRQRRGTAALWTSTNPTLGAGQIGFETDTNRFKIGDGTTAWTSLAYAADTPCGLATHIADTSAAHAASAISFSAVGTIAATDAQTAIAEVATDAASALTTHEADTTSVHGITDTSTLYRSGGTDVAVADGGTGAGDAATARTNLAAAALTPTVGAALGTTGTIDLDMSTLNDTYQTITLTGNPTFTTSNRAAGRSVTVKLSAGGSSRTITWPSWIPLGAALPTTLASGKVAVFTVTFFDTTDAAACASYAAQP